MKYDAKSHGTIYQLKYLYYFTNKQQRKTMLYTCKMLCYGKIEKKINE